MHSGVSGRVREHCRPWSSMRRHCCCLLAMFSTSRCLFIHSASASSSGVCVRIGCCGFCILQLMNESRWEAKSTIGRFSIYLENCSSLAFFSLAAEWRR